MAARTILALLAIAFLLMALVRLSRDDFRLRPASRAWLLVGLIFGGVSGWLWSRVP